MKTQLSNVFVPITKTDVARLTQDVKETLAGDHSSQKIFSAAELWNIQRRHRAVNPVRRFLH